MRRISFTLLSFGALSHVANAVSLADFSPRASNLTPSCEAIYNSQIPNCAPSDFQGSPCSSPCISSLFTYNQKVYDACSRSPQNYNGIIRAYLNGKGVQDICTDVLVTTVQPITTPATSKSSYTFSSPSTHQASSSSKSKHKTTTKTTTLEETLTTTKEWTQTNYPTTYLPTPKASPASASTKDTNSDRGQSCAENGGTPFSSYSGCESASNSAVTPPLTRLSGAMVLMWSFWLALPLLTGTA